MSSQQIKAFVSLRQFNQITNFDQVSEEQNVKAYQFTEELQSLAVRILSNAAAGIGTQAIVADRGFGKSHLLNLIRSIANIPRLINFLEDPNIVAAFERTALPKLPADGFPSLILAFDPEKGLNLVKAFPKIPGLDDQNPNDLIAHVDNIIEQKISNGVQIALFIDGISQFLTDLQQGEALLQWLQELAKEAVNGKFSLIITLDQNIAEGPLRKALATTFKYEYISYNNIVNLIDQKIFVKTPQQRRQLESLYLDLRRRMPYFSESSSKFVQLYPLHPVILKVAPAMRHYARSFSLFSFITAVSSRALLRRVFNLVCLDELFDSFEFDLRKHPALAEAFSSYDNLSTKYVSTLPQQQPLYAKMMLKGLLIFSLVHQSVTAKNLADSLMLYDEKDPFSFIETLNTIMARLATASNSIQVNTSGSELSYKFYIPESTSVVSLTDSSKQDTSGRTITKTIAKAKDEVSAVLQNAIATKEMQAIEAPVVIKTPVDSHQVALDKLTTLANQIPDEEIKLDQILVSAGKKIFKDWPFAFEANKFRDRTEINIKWRGSVRKGIFSFGGETEIFADTESQTPPCEYDWQVIVFRTYAPLVLPPPPEAPLTLLFWQPISLSNTERLVLKKLLVLTEEKVELEENSKIKAELEDQVTDIFQRAYLQNGRLLTNQDTNLHLPTDNSFFASNLTKLLDKLLAKRYSKHPSFEDLLTLETVNELLPWLFQPKDVPTPDQQVSLEQFAKPLDLVITDGTSYKISVPGKDIPPTSLINQLWQLIEKQETITKLQAFKLVHKEPFGLQRPALLLILAILAASKQVVLLDELSEPIHDGEGLRQDIELSDFSTIRLLKGDIKQVSWKTASKKVEPETVDYKDRTLLIVDDDPTIHMVLKIAAQKLKCQVETALDGVSALEKLDKLPVDLVISDLRMPNMTGIELFQNMQNNPKLQKIPFVVLSSIDDDEEVAAALEDGVEDYWIKPLRVNEIQARIKRLLYRQSSPTGQYAITTVLKEENASSKASQNFNAEVKETKAESLNITEKSVEPAIEMPMVPLDSHIDPLTASKLLQMFQQETAKELTILPGKADFIKELSKAFSNKDISKDISQDISKSISKNIDKDSNKPLIVNSPKNINKETLSQPDKVKSESPFNTKKMIMPVLPPEIPHPPIPKKAEAITEEEPVKEVTKEVKKTSNKDTKKTVKPAPLPDGLTIPTRTAEMPALDQMPQFEIKSEEKVALKTTSEQTPASFTINLSNPENMLISIMQLYNQFWDTCRHVGNPSSIPEYEEFKEIVITKANKLKKQFHWDEVTFTVVVEQDQAHVDCQINRSSNFLKSPPKFRLL